MIISLQSIRVRFGLRALKALRRAPCRRELPSASFDPTFSIPQFYSRGARLGNEAPRNLSPRELNNVSPPPPTSRLSTRIYTAPLSAPRGTGLLSHARRHG